MKLEFFKKDDGYTEVVAQETVIIGCIIMYIDGLHYYKPEAGSYSLWHQSTLEEVVNKLKELNEGKMN